MTSRTTLVDDEERGTAEGDSDLDPMLDTQETAAKAAAEEAARPSSRALYVPSPLPMAELKQQLARAADEEATLNAPTQRPPPPTASPHVPAHAPPAPPHMRIGPEPPPPGFEKAIDRRFASNVDSDELSAKRIFAVGANPVPYPQLPNPQPIASNLKPVAPGAEPIAQSKPRSHAFRNAVLFVLVAGLGVLGLGFLHGDLTKADARNAIATLRGATQRLVERVQRR